MSWDENHYVFDGASGSKYNSFWKTVIESPEWKVWDKEQSRRFHIIATEGINGLPKEVGTYDIDEVRECGWISPKHFAEFIQFTIKEHESKSKGVQRKK